jgi:uncharacterized membrane protein
MEYTITKFVHVTLAIVALGANATYGIWLARVAKLPAETQLFVLRTIKVIDDRLANVAYGLLVVTGLFMVFNAGYPLTTRWIASALVLYAIALAMAFTLISPNFRRAIRALESEGPASVTYGQAMSRGRTYGIAISVVVLAIVFLMVTKPT